VVWWLVEGGLWNKEMAGWLVAMANCYRNKGLKAFFIQTADAKQLEKQLVSFVYTSQAIP
jgi:hypothetical protein